MESRRLACETLGRVRCAAWRAGVLACETLGRVNAAQPGNRRRRFAPQREQASSPAKRSALVIFSCASDYYRLHNRRRRDACFPGCAAGATMAKITYAYTTTQARRLLSWLRRGGDYGENYHRLHNRRRRDACVLCFAERLRRWPGSAVGATTAKITTAYTTTQARRMRSLLCRAPKGDGQAAPRVDWWGCGRTETQHHPLRGLCTFDTTCLGLVLTDFTRG